MTFDDRQRERDEMVESQLAAPTDRRPPVLDAAVLQAMRRVPRHRFVPDELQELAYDDVPLAIGKGQTISQPYMVAKMTELLEVERGARVLEVGTGSGYQAALLATMGADVVTIETHAELADRAMRTLRELGLEVDLRVGDGHAGAPDRAPFDAIVVTAAPDRVPSALTQQLAERGRLVVPIGRADHQELVRVTRHGDGLREERLFEVRFVPMTGEPR
jgi:protein-L-isoaspartate(D-aspartate) O-methyltransferase